MKILDETLDETRGETRNITLVILMGETRVEMRFSATRARHASNTHLPLLTFFFMPTT
jgi:hypothetical protein